jgi:DUF1365 family protein
MEIVMELHLRMNAAVLVAARECKRTSATAAQIQMLQIMIQMLQLMMAAVYIHHSMKTFQIFQIGQVMGIGVSAQVIIV